MVSQMYKIYTWLSITTKKINWCKFFICFYGYGLDFCNWLLLGKHLFFWAIKAWKDYV